VSCGPGLRLVSVDVLAEQFAPFGMTRRGFIMWMRALGVVSLEMPDGTLLIDLFDFQLALRVVKRIGSRPLVCTPNSPSNKKRREHKGTTRLTAEEFRAHWKDAVNELLAARDIDYTFTPVEVREAFDLAANRITMALAQLTSDTHENTLSRLKEAANGTAQHV